SRHKMDTRLSQGEKCGRKRMASVAAVYTVAPYLRTAQDVIAGLRHVRDAAPKPRPRPENKRVWASLTRNLRDVIADAFDEACDRDPERSKRWLVLVDGDKKLSKWVRAEARRRGVEITLVLDFIHALEYLWKAAHVFFDRGTPEIETWVLERLERMLEGRISHVVAGMTRMATVRGLSKEERKPVDKAAQYLLMRRRWGMMRYDELLTIGAPIATGIIEGACRHLINDRMDVTGARWRLRSILSSGDFDKYWRFHEQAEARRNHASRYADGEVPPVKRPTGRSNLRVVRSVD
ncbi:MAG: ISKra4 family transposase, partial [Pseudomonadota bacterium]